ncbi:MAG TPA: type II toxin-antitoxin system Phd/YefM family antitoxin [Thermoflexales bacterium]|nr:type II toxin-antitoxin system Phd/YefM family antitoxin [Anaerolineae bacterium]HQV29539.1 type II toxin-antitoxin system Phd/YefM family antitoxin [Thermoflexales bacterium]HQX11798.1 type II toxin-antitoxin system Phd/YefM family antitoxin [Thermoflexales bacterium]HQY25839.1 type II toxin-antitoxin system Phd/YefM family antitoxin [Thermoflexales bacterium]HQZ53423.1 type II toxin-antitoxin system Phd/YefM family antitoxin [Thermoflexales bacterium]
MVVNIHQAKTQLSQLLKRIALGETIYIARDGTPVAQLVPIPNQTVTRLPDLAKDALWVAEDWDSPETNAKVAGMFAGTPPAPARKPRAPRS